MQVNHHYNPGFHGDSKKCDIAHPNGNTEVVPHQPLQKQPASHGVKRGKNQHQRLSHGMKDHIKQKENSSEHNGQNNFESLLCTEFKFVFSRPVKAKPRLQFQFVMQQFGGLLNKPAVISGIQVKIDVACKLS